MTMRGVVVGVTGAVAACGSFGASDGPTDAGTTNADVTEGVDANAVDAGPFCARQPSTLFLCDDFATAPNDANWTELAQDNGGAIEGAEGKFIARGGSGVVGQAWAYLRKELGTLTNEVIFSFAMRNANAGVDAVELGGILIEEPGTIPYACMLNTLPDGTLSIWEVGESPPGVRAALQKVSFAESPPANAVTRFRMHWAISGTPRMRVYVNDAATPAVDMTLTPTRTAGPRQLLVGASHFTKPGVAIEFDDVTIDRR